MFERGEFPPGDWKNYPVDKIDLYCDGEQTQEPIYLGDGKTNFEFRNLPCKDKLIELWLPQYAQFRLRLLELTSGATVTANDDTRPSWVTYGSSITHSKYAESPSKTWPAIVARNHGLNLTNLGFAGNCFLQTEVADLIARMPADFLSMKVGINILFQGDDDPYCMNLEQFRHAIIEFVQMVRIGHADTPLAVISPIYLPGEFEKDSDGHWKHRNHKYQYTLTDMRNVVCEVVKGIHAKGDRNTYYIDGLALLGQESKGEYERQYHIHPNAEGNKTLAQNFLERVAIPLFTDAK